jgi:hypothetical protein
MPSLIALISTKLEKKKNQNFLIKKDVTSIYTDYIPNTLQFFEKLSNKIYNYLVTITLRIVMLSPLVIVILYKPPAKEDTSIRSLISPSNDLL